MTLHRLLAGASALGMFVATAAAAQEAPAASNTASSQEAAQTDVQTDADIVVVGTAQGEKKAIEAKRQADNVVEALYANDVGKLPDQNVAEAVRRLPGLSVANDQGEGRYVIIRGVNPNLVNVVLNGLTLPAPEPDGRQVKLDDIPSALINSVIVTKSLTPDQDANAIGGEVNIRTLTAFDRKASLFADARVQYGSFHLNGEHPYEGDVQVGGRFGRDEQFGAVLSVNYSRRPIESENFQGSTNWRSVTTAAGSTVPSVLLPDQAGLRDYNLVRTRKGVVLNLDWHATDAVKLFLRGTLSRFDDNETRDQFIIDNESAVTANNATTGTFRGRGSERVRRRQEVDNTKSVQGGGNFRFGDAALDIAGAWTRAQKRDPLRSEYNFRTGGSALTVNYDVSGTPYNFIPTVQPNANQTLYGLQSVNYDYRNAVETLWQGRADLTLPFSFGSDGNIKLGVKYLDRHKTNDRDYLTYSLTGNRTFTLANVSYLGDTSFYDRYTFPVRVGYDTAQAYIAANPGIITANVDSSRANSLANDYDVHEQIWAGYAMATAHLGSVTLVPGVRVEHTQDRTKGKLITANSALNSDYNAFGSKDYTNWFPGLNAKWEVTDGLIVRAAATTSLGRPNYPDLSPYVQVDQTTSSSGKSSTTVTLGNPNLKPYKAVNLDSAIEYYLPGQGLISLGYFYKHIDDPIYTGSTLNVNGTYAGQALTGVTVNQATNVDSAVLQGLEANLQVRFTFLPGVLDGFGIAANYAHITGHGEGNIPSGRSGHFPLFLQSRDVGTAQVFYEKYGVAIRAAYSFRSKYLDTLGTTAATDQYTDTNGQLDANVSYEVTPQLTFFGQALNLTDAPWRRFIGTKPLLVERERYGYSFRWGAQLHF